MFLYALGYILEYNWLNHDSPSHVTGTFLYALGYTLEYNGLHNDFPISCNRHLSISPENIEHSLEVTDADTILNFSIKTDFPTKTRPIVGNSNYRTYLKRHQMENDVISTRDSFHKISFGPP